MSRSVTSRSIFVALCVALVASMLLWAPTAEASTKRSVSISASPTAALAGTKITLSGKVSKTPKGANVKIQRKVGKKWKSIKTVQTKKAGKYSASVTLKATPGYYKYRAVATAFEGLRKATSKSVTVTALRQTTFYFAPAYPADADDGATMTVGGSLKAPCTGGGKAFLQKKIGSTWTSTASATVANQAGSVCIFQIQQPDSHEGYYRVLVARSGLNASVTSPERYVSFKF